jgi:hypothetical protein
MIYLSILAAMLLFLVLAATIVRSLHAGSDVDIPGVSGPETVGSGGRLDDANQVLHYEILQRIFNEDDHLYAAQMGDVRIARLLLIERKRVAITWIQRKTAEARFIMREHRRRARTARDLKVAVEARLAVQYLELLALCELFVLAVFFFGPAGLRGLALHTNGILLGIKRLGESTALDQGAAIS